MKIIEKIKIHKKAWWISGLVGTIVVGAVTPIIVIKTQQEQSAADKRYEFEGQVFENQDAMFNYAKTAASKESETTRQRNQWSLNVNNKTLNFTDIKDLNAFANELIVTRKAATSINIESNANGEISTNDYADLNLDYINNLKTIDIYRGKDNSFFTTLTDAKDSYFQLHDTYFFDGIFFRTKEELSVYLERNSDSVMSKPDSLVISAPNQSNSRPIKIDDIQNNNLETKTYIEQFVKENSHQFIEVKSSVNNQDVYKYHDKRSINANTGNLLADFTDPSFVQVISNEGKPNYIIDSSTDDTKNLYGPYYVKSSGSLGNITNKDAWRKIEGKDFNFVDEQRNVELFSNLVNTFVGEDDDDINSPYPFWFGAKTQLNEIQKEIVEYFDYLNRNYNLIYKNVMNLYKTMKSGKRYSSFYKLPILFIHTLEQLIEYQHDQEIIEYTRRAYISIAQYYDMRFKATVPAHFMKSKKTQGKIFSFVDLYGLNKFNLDLNLDIETYFDTIKRDFPTLIDIALFSSIVFYFESQWLDIISFDLNYINELAASKLSSVSTPEGQNAYKDLWNTLLGTDYNEVKTILLKNIADNNSALSQENLDEIMFKLVFSKENASKNMNEEIQKDFDVLKNRQFSTDPKDNYNIFQRNKNSFFYSLSSTNAHTLVKLGKMNNDIVDYKFFALIKANALANGKIDVKKYSDEYYIELLASFKKTRSKMGDLKTVFPFPVLVYEVIHKEDKVSENWELSVQVSEFVKYALSVYNELNDLFDIFSKVVKIFQYAIKSFPLISLAFEIVTNFYQNEKFGYVFESEDVKYIWDGGETNYWFFGMGEQKVTDIDDMKLLPPMQVTSSHIEFGKYYNKVIYYDDSLLKRNQLDDILNNRFKSNKNIKPVYSFKNKLDMAYDLPSNDVYTNLGSLNDNIQTDLVDHVYKEIEKGNSYLTKNIYTYGSGYTFDPAVSVNGNITKIINEIKPTKVATVPTLKDNYPIQKDDTSDDLSLPVYTLPGTSWTATGGFKYNTSKVDYVVYDPNKNSDTKATESDEMITNKMKEIYHNKFDVPTKQINYYDLYRYDRFSQYSQQINFFNVYEIQLDSGYRKIFIDKGAAFRWIMSYHEFAVHDTFNTTTTYTYNGLKFNSLDSYLLWVMESAKEI